MIFTVANFKTEEYFYEIKVFIPFCQAALNTHTIKLHQEYVNFLKEIIIK